MTWLSNVLSPSLVWLSFLSDFRTRDSWSSSHIYQVMWTSSWGTQYESPVVNFFLVSSRDHINRNCVSLYFTFVWLSALSRVSDKYLWAMIRYPSVYSFFDVFRLGPHWRTPIDSSVQYPSLFLGFLVRSIFTSHPCIAAGSASKPVQGELRWWCVWYVSCITTLFGFWYDLVLLYRVCRVEHLWYH